MPKQYSLRVKRTKIVELHRFDDLPDGNLFIAEAGRQIPFEIKRVYFINSLANPKAVRGKHAHKTLTQIIFCISGSFVLSLDDGAISQRVTMKNPSRGILIGPMVWHTMSSFSYDCIILVFASDWYKESDYIREHGAFTARSTRKRVR